MRDHTFCQYEKVLGGIRTDDPQILRRALDHCAQPRERKREKKSFLTIQIFPNFQLPLVGVA